MVRAPGKDVRELAWAAAGASVGSLARRSVDPICPGSGHSLTATFVLAAVAAALIGFALAGCFRASAKTVLFAAGGSAGSISAVAAGAATATPVHFITGLAAFFVGAVIGLLLGIFAAFHVTNSQRAGRC